MSLEIQDKLTLSLFVNGKELVLSRANALYSLQISESVDISVPMVHVVLSDQYEQMSNDGMLADGAELKVIIHPRSSKQKVSCTFRINSTSRSVEGGITKVTIDGYLDVPEYWHSSSSSAFTGTSAACMQSIAAGCGLEADVDSTSDSQTWYPAHTVNHLWARSISKHGYRSSSSCMQLAVTAKKRLLYKDLSKRSAVTAQLSYAEVRPEYVLVTDAAPNIRSGTSNHTGGYFYGRVTQSIFTGTSMLEKVNAVKGAGDRSLMIDGDIHARVASGRTHFSPIDVGNVHEFYEQAAHQNLRLKSLYSATTSVLTPECTDIELLDWVQFNVDSSYGSMAAFGGVYQVLAKAMIVSGTEYVERLELGRRALPVAIEGAL